MSSTVCCDDNTPADQGLTHLPKPPTIGFLDLPGELRNEIYKHVVVKKTRVVLRFQRRLYPLDLNLLLVNKQVYTEASAICFGYNSFDITMLSVPRLETFITKVGATNLSQIKHLEIDFPMITLTDNGTVPIDPDSGTFSVALDETSTRVLSILEEHFVNLTTIRLFKARVFLTYRENQNHHTLDNQRHLKRALALLQVDAALRAIPSLKTIYLLVSSWTDELRPRSRAQKNGLGWELEVDDQTQLEARQFGNGGA